MGVISPIDHPFAHGTIGNITNDGTWDYTWQNGRELDSMTNGSATWDFTYNADGLRTERTNGDRTYRYVYLGGQLVAMTVGSTTMYFNYDANGTPMSVVYNNYSYYYVTNVQGDVIGIVNKEGKQVVSYRYDAWGNLLETSGDKASTVGLNNPLRYRGYVYDRETKLYYLQSRYYDPEMGRFLNADVFVSTGQGFTGNNMFAYCGNNPVTYEDQTGTRFDLTTPQAFDPDKVGVEYINIYVTEYSYNPVVNAYCKDLVNAANTVTDMMVADGPDEFIMLANKLTDNEALQNGWGGVKIFTGSKKLLAGVGRFLSPYVLPQDVIPAFIKIYWGFHNIISGTLELLDQKEVIQ